MAKYCSDCEYLNTSKKKADGLYECKKNKKFVLANTEACPKFEDTYSRTWYEKQDLYDKGKKIQSDFGDASLTPYVIGLVLIILFCIIATILGFA